MTGCAIKMKAALNRHTAHEVGGCARDGSRRAETGEEDQ